MVVAPGSKSVKLQDPTKRQATLPGDWLKIQPVDDCACVWPDSDIV